MNPWHCRTCCERNGQRYRYPPGPDAYCEDCGQPLTTNERGIEVLRGFLAFFEQRGLPLTPPLANEASSPELPGTLTTEEVAQLLHTTPKAIYAKAARGQLPGAFRVGRSLRFRRNQLLSFISKGVRRHRGERHDDSAD
jgi:excisionase family DNA binding protein